MAGLRMVVAAALAVLGPLSWALQLTNTTMFTACAGLSRTGQEALATDVTCSPTLGLIAERFSSVDKSIPTPTSDSEYIYTPTYLPTAPSTLTDCMTYRNYVDISELIECCNYNNSDFLNSCMYIGSAYSVTTEQLMEWNPSLSTNVSNCILQPGYSYCVVQSENSTIPYDDGSICLNINATEPTTVSNCNCLTQVDGYSSTYYHCANIVADSEITEAELLAWNPWLAGDCDTQLYANLGGQDQRSVCIGVDASATTT